MALNLIATIAFDLQAEGFWRDSDTPTATLALHAKNVWLIDDLRQLFRLDFRHADIFRRQTRQQRFG